MAKLTKLPRAIMFDLDGTIAHTIPQLSKAAIAAADECGLVHPSEEKVKEFVGNGINMLLARVIKGEFEVEIEEVSPLLLKKLRESFNTHYQKGLSSDFEVYDGVKECLIFCRECGIKTAIVTNKPEVFAKPLISFMGLSAYFDFILGGEVLKERKPDPRPINYTLEKLQVKNTEALMCGDSDNDIIAANNAFVSSVFFTFGYNRSDEQTLKYDYRFDSYSEFTSLLKELKNIK